MKIFMQNVLFAFASFGFHPSGFFSNELKAELSSPEFHPASPQQHKRLLDAELQIQRMTLLLPKCNPRWPEPWLGLSSAAHPRCTRWPPVPAQAASAAWQGASSLAPTCLFAATEPGCKVGPWRSRVKGTCSDEEQGWWQSVLSQGTWMLPQEYAGLFLADWRCS